MDAYKRVCVCVCVCVCAHLCEHQHHLSVSQSLSAVQQRQHRIRAETKRSDRRCFLCRSQSCPNSSVVSCFTAPALCWSPRAQQKPKATFTAFKHCPLQAVCVYYSVVNTGGNFYLSCLHWLVYISKAEIQKSRWRLARGHTLKQSV